MAAPRVDGNNELTGQDQAADRPGFDLPGREPGADDQVERTIGNLLRAGVLVAAAVAAAGGVVYLARHGGETPDDGVFRGEPADLRSPVGVVRDALTGSGRGLIQLGALLLIATPVARVAFTVYAFGRRRDVLYVVVTLVVLTLLLFSLLGGG
jgi:uncharacterized membrane protein